MLCFLFFGREDRNSVNKMMAEFSEFKYPVVGFCQQPLFHHQKASCAIENMKTKAETIK